MSTVLDIVGSIIAIAFFFAFKERHWHKIKDAERKTRRRR